MNNLTVYIKSESKAFPNEIYADVVDHAKVYKDGSVVYHLRFGVEWTIDEGTQLLRRNAKNSDGRRSKQNMKNFFEDQKWLLLLSIAMNRER
ncbi:hypothetical protein KHA80_12400 [Anaerobacillus sp. HL2]|nr:hypothetical protein KHA80_12400 [Anaerobacillus sp. HL2]